VSAFFGLAQLEARFAEEFARLRALGGQHEHETAGDLLKRLRRLTADFTAPDDGCASYRSTYGALEELERDLMRHIHLENNIVFARVKG